MRIGCKQPRHEILFLHRHARAAFAAAVLRAVGGKRHTLHIPAMRHRHDHVFTLDEVFIVEVGIHKGEL